MAERKIVEVEEEKEKKKSSGINIDLSELKKIGAAILAFVVANPELVSKILNKPATYLKKIVNGEDVSKNTKKKVNKTIDDSKSGGLTSILSSLGSLSSDSETMNIFSDISKKVSKAKVGNDAVNLLGGLLNTNTSKSKKKSNNSSGLSSILKGLFK